MPVVRMNILRILPAFIKSAFQLSSYLLDVDNIIIGFK